MSWTDLGAVKFRRPETSAFRLAVEKRGIRISFPDALQTEMGWKQGDALTLLRGEGEHHGFARLIPAASGDVGWVLHPIGGGPGTKGLRVMISRAVMGEPTLPGLPDRLTSTAIEHERVGDSGVQFRLPWLNIDVADAQGSANRAPADAAPAPARSAGPHHAGDPVSGGGSGSPEQTADRAGPPTPRPFPVQPKSLAEVEAAPFLPSDPATWPAGARERFVAAAIAGEPNTALAKICGRPLGSIGGIINKWFPEVIEPRRRAVAERLALPPRPPATPPKPADPTRQAEEDAIAQHIAAKGVKHVMPPEAVAQMLRDAGHQVLIRESNENGAGQPYKHHREPVIDGKRSTMKKLYESANELRAKGGLPPLAMPGE